MIPMSAAKIDLSKANYPLIGSPKVDGFRAVVMNGVVLSRRLKPFPNLYVQAWARAFRNRLQGLDGEMVVGRPNDPNVMQTTASGLMSVHGEPDFTFLTFDIVNLPEVPYIERLKRLTNMPVVDYRENLVATMLHDEQALIDFELLCLKQGYEGIMLRDPQGPYKYGRSTMREGYLMKLKRFTDEDAVVTGYFEEEANNNPAVVDPNTGRSKRSSHQENKEGKGRLGGFIARTTKDGRTVRVGSGFNSVQRDAWWPERKTFIGRTFVFRHFDHGVKEAPRHPVFHSFREE